MDLGTRHLATVGRDKRLTWRRCPRVQQQTEFQTPTSGHLEWAPAGEPVKQPLETKRTATTEYELSVTLNELLIENLFLHPGTTQASNRDAESDRWVSESMTDLGSSRSLPRRTTDRSCCQSDPLETRSEEPNRKTDAEFSSVCRVETRASGAVPPLPHIRQY